jgi:hypothetical protein
MFKSPWKSIHPPLGLELTAELKKEINEGHPLFGEKVIAIARRVDCDDVLFSIINSEGRLAVVHLTWSEKRKESTDWPAVDFYESLADFKEQRMFVDCAD